MLHNTTREQLLQAGQGYVALVIDALYVMGFKTYHTFKAHEAIELLSPLGTAPKIVRIALKHPLFEKKGQRNAIYTLPAASSARKAVAGDENASHRDELPQEAYKSLKSYRMALHHTFVKRRKERSLRILLARRLGVCKNTTRNYDRELHHIFKESYDFLPLTPDNMTKLSNGAPYNWKYRLWIKTTTKQFFAPPDIRMVNEWIKKKAAVYLAQQMGNIYFPDDFNRSYVEGEYADFIQH